MSKLEVRKMQWDFEGVPFLWNPKHPGFSVMTNMITFLIVGFERYITKSTRLAEELIDDPDVALEARLYRQQEAVHAAAHLKHAKALIKQHPGLQSTFDDVLASYDELFDSRSLDFHLAYAAGLESVFTPFFKMILDNRAVLFAGGDSRLASMLLWHFCEEIEHRNSALAVYNAVVGSEWYRIRNTPRFHAHIGAATRQIEKGFKEHVPEVPPSMYKGSPFSGVPRMDQLRSGLGIAKSQLPGHDPIHQPLPRYYEEWVAQWQAGDDVTEIYGTSPELVRAAD